MVMLVAVTVNVAWATLKLALTALVRPLALAVNCWLPAELICKPEKVTTPFPALSPMSRFAVP